MKGHKLFEQLCNEYDLNYTKVPSERGIMLSYKGKELKLTKEYIDAMFRLDEYLKMSPYDIIDTKEVLPEKNAEITFADLVVFERFDFSDEAFELAA